MKLLLPSAAVLALALQAAPAFSQTAPATPDSGAPAADSSTMAPKKTSSHHHHSSHHKTTTAKTDKSIPDSSTQTPTESAPK
jgi:hypothetical protein